MPMSVTVLPANFIQTEISFTTRPPFSSAEASGTTVNTARCKLGSTSCFSTRNCYFWLRQVTIHPLPRQFFLFFFKSKTTFLFHTFTLTKPDQWFICHLKKNQASSQNSYNKKSLHFFNLLQFTKYFGIYCIYYGGLLNMENQLLWAYTLTIIICHKYIDQMFTLSPLETLLKQRDCNLQQHPERKHTAAGKMTWFILKFVKEVET